MFLYFPRQRFQDATGHKYKQEPPKRWWKFIFCFRDRRLADGSVFSPACQQTEHQGFGAIYLSSAESRRAPCGRGVNLAKRAVCQEVTPPLSVPRKQICCRAGEKKLNNKNSTSPSCGCGFTRPDCTISLHVTAFYRR